MITIKNFLDCPEVLPLVAERIYNEWFTTKPGHTLESMLTRLRTGRRSEVPIGLVAFYDGAPAGTVSLLENDLEERRELTPWLAGLLVFPGFQGRGIGSALTRELMAIGGKIGVSTMYLWTEKPGVYERLGWEKLCEVRSDPGSNVMSCSVKDSA